MPAPKSKTAAAQLPFVFSPRSAFGREDFMTSACNFEAVAWLDKFPAWPSHALIVWGPEGCGKTHLAHVFMAKAAKDTPLVSALDLTIAKVPELVALSGSLALENADAEGVNEEALLHLYNFIKDNGGYLFMTAHLPPKQWPQIKLPDLSSRLNAVPAVNIGSPDDALMRAVLVKLFADRQLDIKADALEYLIRNMERSFASARMIVATADKLSLARHKGLTIPVLKEVLASEPLPLFPA